MSATRTLLTAEQFDNYPFEEDKRYELDETELIAMPTSAYRHNGIVSLCLVEIMLYSRQTHMGRHLPSENLYALSATTRRPPNLAVILGDRRAELRDATVIPINPAICVEVL